MVDAAPRVGVVASVGRVVGIAVLLRIAVLVTGGKEALVCVGVEITEEEGRPQEDVADNRMIVKKIVTLRG